MSGGPPARRSASRLRRGSTALPSRAPDAAELRLFEEAGRVALNAHAPYSGYGVGAALVAESGRVHLGVNVENAAYPAGLCAERAALAAMVTAGERALRTVAVAAAFGADCLPCGLCLQALAEFGDPDVVARAGGALRVLRLSDLLTAPFAAGGAAWGATAPRPPAGHPNEEQS